jgi:hypothetical protein
MKFTTHFALQSQTTRLVENVTYADNLPASNGIITLSDVLFQATSAGAVCENISLYYNSVRKRTDFKFELFPVHSPLLRESLLVSFPPLINMLKFSG